MYIQQTLATYIAHIGSWQLPVFDLCVIDLWESNIVCQASLLTELNILGLYLRFNLSVCIADNSQEHICQNEENEDNKGDEVQGT